MIAKLQLNLQINLRAVCSQLDLSETSVRRWRTRAANGQPLLAQPGPKKLGPLPIEEVAQQIERMLHGKKRSRGSGALYQRYRAGISRRGLNACIGQTRAALLRLQRQSYQRIQWKKPNLVWAIDATEYGKDQHGRRLFLVVVIDLASRFVFPPLITLDPSGDAVAAYLQSLFARYGRPLFLKRDNGSFLNHQLIEVLLAEQGVIPLNSPAYYPRYNGAVEKGIRELKCALRDCLPSSPPAWDLAVLTPIINARTYLCNGAQRRCLGRVSAARAYLEAPAARFTNKVRHATFQWITQRSAAILNSLEHPNRRSAKAAWREAVKAWLLSHKLILVHSNNPNQPKQPNINQHVSPLF